MDTLVRLVDTKYYENSKDKMVTTLSILHRNNNRIIVAPRIDQNTQKELLTIQHCISDLPEVVKERTLQLDDFRMDISSSLLRSQA
jgi:hypothetical protein